MTKKLDLLRTRGMTLEHALECRDRVTRESILDVRPSRAGVEKDAWKKRNADRRQFLWALNVAITEKQQRNSQD